MAANPYQSPGCVEDEETPRTERRRVTVLRMAYRGLVLGTFHGIAFGALAGGLLAAMFVMQATFLASPVPNRFAESAVQSTVEGVFTGAMVGFVMLAPLAALQGLFVSITSLRREHLLVVSMLLCGAAFSIVGAVAGGWFSVMGLLICGCVGVVAGQSLGRAMAALAGLGLQRDRVVGAADGD